MTLWLAIIPQDYSSADAEVFRTESDAKDYVREQAESNRDKDHYMTIRKVEV